MKVLVTGGAGFIGSHLVDELVRRGHEVVSLDSLEKQVHTTGKPSYLNREARYIFGDMRDGHALASAIEGAEVIFHNASAVGVGQSMYEIERYVDINTLGTAKLLDFLVNKEHSVKKMIVASSMSIYGEGAYKCGKCGIVYPALRHDSQMKRGEWEMKCPGCGHAAGPVPTPEEKPLYPTSIYAITKRDQEEMCLVTGRSYGIPTVALRYFNVYGPRQSLSNPYTGVCAIFSSRIKNGNPPLIFEDGRQTRDFVNVKDIVQANVISMQNKGADYKSLNVGTGTATSIGQVAETLAKLYGKDIKPRIAKKYRSGDIRHCFSDISKIMELGYEPSVTLEEGMRELTAWGGRVDAVDATERAEDELKKKGLIK